MKTRLVRIGNSRGIRIPKAMLEEAGLEDEVDIKVSSDGLRITPTRAERKGWARAAKQLADHSEGGLLDAETPTVFDEAEWEW